MKSLQCMIARVVVSALFLCGGVFLSVGNTEAENHSFSRSPVLQRMDPGIAQSKLQRDPSKLKWVMGQAPRNQPRPEPRPQPRPEPRPQPRPEPRPQPRPEPRPGWNRGPTLAPKPAPRPQPEPHPGDRQPPGPGNRGPGPRR